LGTRLLQAAAVGSTGVALTGGALVGVLVTEAKLARHWVGKPSGEPPAADGVYGSGPGREIEVCEEVRSGDAIVMPHGYHGPSMAAPGYDLYYLNVMAGPGERAWRFTDDPAHAWIRDSWAGQEMDPRLPLSTPAGRPA
jgi:5-deoxy-glucuronate isomerase